MRSVKDVQERPLVVGATNQTAIGAIYPAIMNRFMGTKFKIVLGYKAGEAMLLGQPL